MFHVKTWGDSKIEPQVLNISDTLRKDSLSTVIYPTYFQSVT